MKPTYQDFFKHEPELIKRLNSGVSASEIIARIEKRFHVDQMVKLKITSLNKPPQEQTTAEWLANYIY